MTDPVLAGRSITRRFGGVTAVSDVDIDIYAGAVTLLLGPNGAGKSTLVNCLTGVDRPDSGQVLLNGQDVTGKRSDQFTRMRVVRTFQHARPFTGLTVAENVMVGAHARTKAGFIRGTLRTPLARREEVALRAQAEELLSEVGLAGRGHGRPVDLPLADERRLELARCLAAEPRVLLLDEPAAGLGEAEADDLARLVRRLCADHNLGVLLIDHHLELALGMSDTVVALDFGRVIARGTPDEIRQDAAVQEAYLGVQEDA